MIKFINETVWSVFVGYWSLLIIDKGLLKIEGPLESVLIKFWSLCIKLDVEFSNCSLSNHVRKSVGLALFTITG